MHWGSLQWIYVVQKFDPIFAAIPALFCIPWCCLPSSTHCINIRSLVQALCRQQSWETNGCLKCECFFIPCDLVNICVFNGGSIISDLHHYTTLQLLLIMLATGNSCMFTDFIFFFMGSSNLLFVKTAIVSLRFYSPHRDMGNMFKWTQDRNQKFCQI